MGDANAIGDVPPGEDLPGRRRDRPRASTLIPA
jgi:hypothetical protein